MADNEAANNESTNEQPEVKAKFLTEDEITDWGNNTRLVLPGDEPEEPAEDDSEAADDAADDTTDESSEDQDDADLPEPAEPIKVVPNPGEFKPSDHSFTITLADGKSVTIRTPEDADRIGDDPENFETPKQLLDFVRKSQKMQQAIDKEREDYDKAKAAYDEQQELIELTAREELRIKNEFEYLVERGDLPELPPNADKIVWRSDEHKNKPGIKEHLALITYMEKENNRRMKRNLTPLTSPIDAFASYQVEVAKKQKSKAKVEAGAQRKEMGARVASGSPAPVSYRPKGIAVGRVGNLRNLGATWEV